MTGQSDLAKLCRTPISRGGANTPHCTDLQVADDGEAAHELRNEPEVDEVNLQGLGFRLEGGFVKHMALYQPRAHNLKDRHTLGG